MRAYQITGTEGLSALRALDLPTPDAAHGQVLVRIRAVSLNYRDYMNVTGSRGVGGPIPRIPCSDGAGEVCGVGEGVSGWEIGDRVVAPFMPTWVDGGFTADHSKNALGGAVDGMLREMVSISAASLLRIPDHMSFEEAATLPCAAVTAWQALIVRGGLKPGETVLIQGSGGVSVFALQFAKLAGARVFAITSSDQKAARLKELGAEAVHNYRTDPEWDRWVMERTSGLGVDKVVEIGGPETLNRSVKAVRFGGHVALIGVLTGVVGDIQTVNILRKGVRLDGIYVGSRAMFADMLAAIEQAKLRPVIDTVFEFRAVHAAFERLASGGHFGKIVVRV